jgi:hypothetical protein
VLKPAIFTVFLLGLAFSLVTYSLVPFIEICFFIALGAATLCFVKGLFRKSANA